VALFRYNGSAWQELDTKVVESGSETVAYEAKSPGFSFFAIGKRLPGKGITLPDLSGLVVPLVALVALAVIIFAVHQLRKKGWRLRDKEPKERKKPKDVTFEEELKDMVER
ncbi:MAG: PGF-pre-PGF domain-containing protein, partial [Candidatus Aenigmarchaeota archaeon]|nr:PGF-pre-PGF domain-containing protein [Candidatus Aenigmarchaeota archaeon]